MAKYLWTFFTVAGIVATFGFVTQQAAPAHVGAMAVLTVCYAALAIHSIAEDL